MNTPTTVVNADGKVVFRGTLRGWLAKKDAIEEKWHMGVHNPNHPQPEEDSPNARASALP